MLLIVEKLQQVQVWYAVLLLWAGLLTLIMTVRALHRIVWYGPRAYFREALKIEGSTWILFAVFLWVTLALLISCTWPTGLGIVVS